MDRRRIIMTAKKSRLPLQYQEVEFIESTGTQCINTNIVIDINTTIKATAAGSGTSDSTQILFGESAGGAGRWVGIVRSQNKWGLGQADCSDISYSAKVDINYVFGSISTCYFNASLLTRTPSSTISFNLSASPSRYPFIGRIYKMSVEKNGRTTNDLVPCYRRIDNEAGLYDLVNNVFYTNQGTGSFLAGREII